MKICYILPHFYPHVGGAEQAFMDIIEELNKNENIEIRVVTSNSGGITGMHKYKDVDVYSYEWKIMFGHPWCKKRDLIEHIKWADIVHTAVYTPVIPTTKLCMKLKKPCIVTAHEVLGNKWFWIEPNKIKALMFKIYESLNVHVKCDFYQVPSEATRKDLINCNKKAKVETIYWISDKELEEAKIDKKKLYDYFDITGENKVFLNYGRPGKTKGIFVYLNAIDELVKSVGQKELENIKFCFIMANDPIAEKEKFIKQVNEKKLDKYIVVRDSVSREDLNNYIECADYIVVPSITEGFGLTAIEACERGKKVIHSSAGSLPEVTFGNVLQFENKNSSDLTECLKKVIIVGDSVFKEKNKKDFSRKTISGKFLKLYDSVLNDK